MKIGIDVRLWNETGVGRYIRALVRELGNIDKHNEYTLFLRQPQYEEVIPPNSRWKKVLADVPWHTIQEQFKMPAIYQAANIDLLHIPYFAVPVLIQVPFVVTIHDLTISHFATGKATSLPLPIYWLKRLGYTLVLSQTFKRARQIITVSETVKKQIMSEFSRSADKICVIYESGSLEPLKSKATVVTPKNYLLYVGNAHPHKNLERLVKAYALVKRKVLDLNLVLVGKTDYFYSKLKIWVNAQGITGVKFIGEVNNEELAIWYKNALSFVFPSLSEGFGIPGLEAMSMDCPVIASDIQTFREIYKDAAIYFDPNSEVSLASVTTDTVKNSQTRERLVKKGRERVQYFSWNKMARQTLEVYENCIDIRSGQ